MAGRTSAGRGMSLLTPGYMELQRILHAEGDYGIFRSNSEELVRALIARDGFNTVLDYGCGQGRLKASLGDCVTEYDPCIDGKDADPKPADLVVCTDVLE